MQTNYFTRVEGNWSPYDDVVLEELMRFYKSYELVAEHGLLHFTRSFSQDQIKRRWEKILYNGKTSSLSRLHMPTESRLLKRAVSEPFSEEEDKIIRIHIIEKEMKTQEKNKDNNKNGEDTKMTGEEEEKQEKQEKQEQHADDDIAMEVGEKNVGEKQKEEFVEADNNSNEKKTHETRTTHGLKDFALLLTKFEREFHPNRTPFCLQQRYLHLLRERRAGNTDNNNNNNNNKKNNNKNNKNNEVVGVKGQWDLPALEAALVRSIGG